MGMKSKAWGLALTNINIKYEQYKQLLLLLLAITEVNLC